MRRTMLVAAIGALALTGGLATSAAAAAATPDETAGSTSTATSGMLHAMQRDLGLTSTQAHTRMAQETTARHAEKTLRHRLGHRFGGAYFDTKSGQLVVGVTNDSDAATVTKAGARAHTVTHSQSSLNTAKVRLDKARKSAPSSVTSWYVDVTTNKVVVTAKKSADQASVQKFAAKAKTPAVRVAKVTRTPRPLADVVGGQAWYGSNFRCSVGFSATGSDGNYMVSAGHCTGEGGTASGYNRVQMGPMTGDINSAGDYGVVHVTNSAWTLTPQVENSPAQVAGSQESTVGSSVCRSGSTTGWHCGTVNEKNASVQYPDVTVTGLTGTDVCAEPGDSGGSFISDDQAQGMTSGGSGDCTSGGVTYFQPVNEALQNYSLTLTTS